MRKAKNRFERSRQVLGWLKNGWPPGRPVELIWVKEVTYEDDDGAIVKCYGQTYREGRHIVIELSKRRCRTWEGSTEALIHEFSHAVLWGPASIENTCEHHPVQFYALQGEIQNRWDHDNGWEHANDFEF